MNRVRTYTAVCLLFAVTLPLRADDMSFANQQANLPEEPVASNQIASVVDQSIFAEPQDSDVWTRSRLTGNWFGSRDSLSDAGFTIYGDITQYYQGVVSGGVKRRFEYGGRGDYLVDLDSQKLGLWSGGRLDLRGESRLGLDTNRIDGAFAASNLAMMLPLPNQNVTALTGVQYTQDVSENVSVFAGKLNLLDGTVASYEQARRLNSFWNAAMQTNISRIFLLPSSLGTGFTIRDETEPIFNFYLLDTHFTPTTSGFSSFLTNGVVAYGEYRLRMDLGNLPGHSAVGLLYSTATRTTLDSNPYLISPISPGTPLATKSDAWTVTYRFDQVVYRNVANPNEQWTLNGDFGLSDGNPNPILWFANLTLVGTSPLPHRETDTVGIGYYHLGVSDVQVLKTLNFGAEDGVELYYNAAVTPWFHVTPDVQVLDPSQRDNATALLLGVRARLSF